MKPRSLVLCFLILFSPATLFANTNLTGRWTNDWQEFFSQKPNDGIWNFEGDDLHEGGYMFRLQHVDDSSFLLMDREDGFAASIGKKGDRVVYREIDGHRLLIMYSPAGTIADIFRSIDNTRTLLQIITEEKTAYELAGIYLDLVSGREVVFDPGKPEAKGLLEKATTYEFESSFDFPQHIIRFKNRVGYWYVRTDSSLELYGLVHDSTELYSWTKGRKLRTLKRTGWLDQTSGKQPGRYGFASMIALTPAILTYFSKEERRIMRNEVYARHGYIFKSPELQAYFAAQPWYKPVEGVGEAHLTELEKLNARIIADHAAPNHH